MSVMREFFDGHASRWDGYQREQDYAMVERIIDRIAPGPADDVLDVGCGTGILVPYLAHKGIRGYLGMDISREMGLQFKKKFPRLGFVLADFARPCLKPAAFSQIIIFNAFPHFEDEAQVFRTAAGCLKPGGQLTIAHSMNREQLNEHHRQAGMAVEDHVLISDGEFRDLYKKAGFVDLIVEDTDHFFSRGIAP